MDIELLRQAIRESRVNVTSHADEEMENDAISQQQLFDSVLGGEVIADYPNDFPFPSCLILGFDESGRAIHSVWAYSQEQQLAFVVTAYVPDPDRWIDFRVRRDKV